MELTKVTAYVGATLGLNGVILAALSSPDYYEPWKRRMQDGGVVLVSVAAVITFVGQADEYLAEEDGARRYLVPGAALFTAILLVATIYLLRRARIRLAQDLAEGEQQSTKSEGGGSQGKGGGGANSDQAASDHG